MTTARITLSTLFGTVNTTASALTNTIGTISDVVDMGNMYVSKLAKTQRLDHAAELAQYKTKLQRRIAMEESAAKKEVLDFCAKSTQNAELYEQSYNEIVEILKDL